MGTRVPVQHYDLRSAAASYIETSLQDLNAAEGHGGAGDDVDRGGGDVTEDSLDNDEESTVVVSITYLYLLLLILIQKSFQFQEYAYFNFAL